MEINKPNSTEMTKELKIHLLRLLKEGVITPEHKEELIKILEIPTVVVEIIDKREQVEQDIIC